MAAAEERVRVILGGGEPKRQGGDRTAEDIALEEAAYYDSVARLYGWPPGVVDDVPADLLADMLRVARIRSQMDEQSARSVQQQMNSQAGR